MLRISTTLLAFVLFSTLAACGAEERPPYPERQRTRGTAVLPPTPDLYPKLAPVHYDDGTWSVHGVLETGKQLPKIGIQVKGYVAALHTCPADAKRCNPAPFVQLTHRENLQGRRLLVGGAIDPVRDNLKLGKIATLTGKFATRSANGLYFAPSGLLLFLTPEDVAAEAAARTEKAALEAKAAADKQKTAERAAKRAERAAKKAAR